MGEDSDFRDCGLLCDGVSDLARSSGELQASDVCNGHGQCLDYGLEVAIPKDRSDLPSRQLRAQECVCESGWRSEYPAPIYGRAAGDIQMFENFAGACSRACRGRDLSNPCTGHGRCISSADEDAAYYLDPVSPGRPYPLDYPLQVMLGLDPNFMFGLSAGGSQYGPCETKLQRNLELESSSFA